MANWLREQFCNLVYFTDFSVQQIPLKKIASKEIFSPSNKIHREVVRAKDLSAPLCVKVADKSLAQPGRKKATATEDFEFYISYL